MPTTIIIKTTHGEKCQLTSYQTRGDEKWPDLGGRPFCCSATVVAAHRGALDYSRARTAKGLHHHHSSVSLSDDCQPDGGRWIIVRVAAIKMRTEINHDQPLVPIAGLHLIAHRSPSKPPTRHSVDDGSDVKITKIPSTERRSSTR